MHLLILDVDGVMTDGTKIYNDKGETIAKRFHDHDWTAIKKFQKDGWHVCWLSADLTVNAQIAKDRGITFWFSRNDDGTIDKVSWLHYLCKHYDVPYENTVYVGDDLFDLPVMRVLLDKGGKAFCPSNAVPQVRKVAQVLNSPGGAGAIMELYYSYSQDDSQPCG
jgi:3-deoxy-D-manno-octulosonate 8-phosphate phosphatase (KDO 8-P phosphatase)